MAKIKNGILGPLSGKIGPVIGGTWKGITYLKAVSKATPKPRTPGQIATQEKMRYLNKFLVPFHPYITVGMKNEAAQQTEISAAFTANYHETILGVHPHLSVDCTKLVFSKGNLPMMSNMIVERIAPNTIQFTWNSLSDRAGNYNDQLMPVVYCSELHATDGFIGGISRNAKRCIFNFNERFIGKTIDVYASITSLDRKKIANNVYLGRLDKNIS